MSDEIQIISLKNQNQFAAVNKLGKRLVGRYFIIVFAAQYDSSPPCAMYLGMKVGKSIGSAVVRNKMKRRIRYMTREIYKVRKEQLRQCGIIVIPKFQAISREYKDLFKDFESVITSVKALNK